MKWLIIVTFCLKSVLIFGQSDKPISIDDFDYNHLNQLIHNKINNIRIILNISELQRNEVAQFASQNHANYLSKQKKLTHYQKNTKNNTVTD
jgi:uncharacterized protein YkwD